MSDFFSSLSCCWFWLVAGILIGWLLNRYLCRCCCKPSQINADSVPPPPQQSNRQTNALTVDTSSNLATVEASKATPSVKKTRKSTPAKSSVKSPAPAKAKIVTPKVSFDVAAAKAAGFSIKQANDLTVIEGIGPKINELFKEHGIQTFTQLAQQTVPQMRAILDKGGARYRIANPATWAQQADLAANNEWAALKKLQDSLSGGVKK